MGVVGDDASRFTFKGQQSEHPVRTRCEPHTRHSSTVRPALFQPYAAPTLAKISGACDGGESACRPGSVRPLARVDGHPSGTAVADSLVRSTREHRAGSPQALAQARVTRALLTLLRVGFTEPPQSPAVLVVSYTTVSPLPRNAGRFVFCGTVPRVTPGRRYRPPCPVEPGPSSPGSKPGATARPTHPSIGYSSFNAHVASLMSRP